MWELVQIGFQLLYALVLLVLIPVLLCKVRRKRKCRESPDLLYIFFRYQAKKILNEKTDENTSQLEGLKNSISDLICKRLDLSFLSKEEELHKIQEIEKEISKKLSEIWETLKTKVPKGMKNKDNDLLNALNFELDSGLMERPSDVLGRRRSYSLKTLLQKQIENGDELSKDSCLKICFRTIEKIKSMIREIPGIEDILNKQFFFQFIFVKTVLLTLFIHCYDYFTDGMVIGNFYNIAYGGQIKSIWTYSKMLGSEGIAGVPEVERFTDLENETTAELENLNFRNTFSMIGFLSFLLLCVVLVSVILLVPALPSLYWLYEISIKMLCSKTERDNSLDSRKFLNRFNFARSESGTESNMQLTFQMATYLVMTWQLTWFATKVSTGSEDFFHISALWSSFAMSIFSISMGQLKTRMVLHEFSTTASKKISYLLACILNTIFASLIWIPLVVAVLDCTNFGGLELSAGGGVLLPSGRWHSKMLGLGFFLSLLLVIIIPSVSSILRLPTSAVSPDITSLSSEDFLCSLMKRMAFIAALLCANGMLNFRLLVFARDTVSPALIDFGSRFPNFTIPFTSGEEFLTPSTVTEENARRNFILLSIILMPLCFVGSIFMLHLYFKDSTWCMKFNKTHRNFVRAVSLPWGATMLPRCISSLMRPRTSFCCNSLPSEEGFWEDLTDIREDKDSLHENPFLCAGEHIDHTLLDSVMKSFPFWKNNKTFENLAQIPSILPSILTETETMKNRISLH